jgi:hypothetical protein
MTTDNITAPPPAGCSVTDFHAELQPTDLVFARRQHQGAHQGTTHLKKKPRSPGLLTRSASEEITTVSPIDTGAMHLLSQITMIIALTSTVSANAPRSRVGKGRMHIRSLKKF